MGDIYSLLGVILVVVGMVFAAGRWVGNVDKLLRQVLENPDKTPIETQEYMNLSLRAIKRSNRNQNAITLVSAIAVVVLILYSAYLSEDARWDSYFMNNRLDERLSEIEGSLSQIEESLSLSPPQVEATD